MTQPVSRRRFLKMSCLTAAGIGLAACGGVSLAATRQPQIDMPVVSLGEKNMNKRTLIAYATKAGSTAEVAARIAQALAHGQAVDVKPVGQVQDLAGYDTVVLGSAVRMGKVLPELQRFVEQRQAELAERRLHTFVVCLSMIEDTPENRATASAALEPLRALVQPVSEGLFAGALDPAKLSLLDRFIARMVKSPVGDWRRWDEVQAWAEQLAAA